MNKLRIRFDREEDGRWLAEVPTLPGVVAYARDRQAAADQAEVLAMRVLADRLEHGEDVPPCVRQLFTFDEPEENAAGRAGVVLAGDVLEPEDFSDWPGYPGERTSK